MPSVHTKRSLLVRAALGLGLCSVLALGFIGYLSPGMRLNWETIASMCGF